jgi:glycosyltransferase involved in cell wall biosynthesis
MSKVHKPIITIIIATFNSEKLVPRVLKSIFNQTLPKNKIEILFIDGGSTDGTLTVAKKYNCKVVNNPKTEPVYAKYLGYLEAKGQYIMYLDHDEVLENKKCLELRLSVFQENSKIKAVIGSGYKSPPNIHFINNYINEFGDPFSFFMYKLSKDVRYFINTMRKRYPIVSENEQRLLFDFSKVKVLPIIELCAFGSMIDASYMKKEFPETLQKSALIPHFFYLFSSKTALLAITKNDCLIHYSSDTIKKYLAKIKWRIKNNIYHKSDMGRSGFSGRENYQPVWLRLRKYFYVPYVYTIIFCLLDAAILAATRNNNWYFIHVLLSLYTASLIMYHSVLNLLGYKPVLKSYDEKKIIQ